LLQQDHLVDQETREDDNVILINGIGDQQGAQHRLGFFEQGDDPFPGKYPAWSSGY